MQLILLLDIIQILTWLKFKHKHFFSFSFYTGTSHNGGLSKNLQQFYRKFWFSKGSVPCWSYSFLSLITKLIISLDSVMLTTWKHLEKRCFLGQLWSKSLHFTPWPLFSNILSIFSLFSEILKHLALRKKRCTKFSQFSSL